MDRERKGGKRRVLYGLNETLNGLCEAGHWEGKKRTVRRLAAQMSHARRREDGKADAFGSRKKKRKNSAAKRMRCKTPGDQRGLKKRRLERSRRRPISKFKGHAERPVGTGEEENAKKIPVVGRNRRPRVKEGHGEGTEYEAA